MEFLYVGKGEVFEIRILCGLDAYDAHFEDGRMSRCPGRKECELCAKGSRTFPKTVFAVLDKRDDQCKAWVVSPTLLNEMRNQPHAGSSPYLCDVRVWRTFSDNRLEQRTHCLPLPGKQKPTKKESELATNFREKWATFTGKSINIQT